MRILHTSDWHLGMSMHNIPMLEEQRHFKENLIKIIVDEKVDGVIVAGDVFDSSVSNSDAIGLYNDIVTDICLRLGVPMMVISGNHDGAARLSSMHELLKNSKMFVCGKLTRNIKPVSFDDTDVYMIPFFNIDEVRYLYPDMEIKSYESAMNTVCEEIRTNMDKSKTNIVVAHAFVGGAQLSDSERSALVETVNIVSKEVFKGFSYTALGHIHRKQRLSDTVFYSGSPLKYSINEAAHTKYVLIYDSYTDTIKEVKVHPFREMRVIEGTYDEIIHSDTSDDYVKVIIKDKYIGMDILEVVRSLFPNLISIEGKNIIENDNINSLNMEQVRNMKPSEIIKHFFEENFESDITDKQLEDFLQALEQSEKGALQ